MKRILIAASLLAVFFAGCSPVQPSSDQTGKPSYGEYRLPLIETTDMHGHILTKNGDDIQYGLAYIADKANDLRGKDSDRLLLLDGGDLYQGASVSNLLGGRPVYVAFDKMGYDAVAVGNHEFDWDFDTLADPDATLPDYEWNGTACINDVPVLCANLYLNGNRVSSTRDYVIVEKSAVNQKGETLKVKIGIIGFAINYASSIMASKFTGKGYSIKEDYSIANDIAEELEQSGRCDMTILLIHGQASYAADRLGKDSAIDLVLGGHSHQTLKGIAGSGVSYLQGGRYAEHFAYSNLVFAFRTDPDRIHFKNVEEQMIFDVAGDLSGRDENNFDKNILAVSDEALSAIATQMKDVVGFITYSATTYDLKGSGGRASTMSNWMCDIIRRIGEADVSFINSGGIRTTMPLNGKSRRDITVADVYEIFPFGNTTYVYKITYADLLQLLKYSLTNSGGSLFSNMTGIDCHFRGKTVLSLSKNGKTIYQDGRWTDDWESRTLILAVSEYLATGERTDSETRLSNPLPEWNRTERLLYNYAVDNENAILVLREEAAASDGHLYIDNKPHYIEEE